MNEKKDNGQQPSQPPSELPDKTVIPPEIELVINTYKPKQEDKVKIEKNED